MIYIQYDDDDDDDDDDGDENDGYYDADNDDDDDDDDDGNYNDDDEHFDYVLHNLFLSSLSFFLDFSSFITSVVLNNDLICRLNFINLCNLRQLVLELISRSKVNKMIILQAMFRDYELNDLIYAKGMEIN